MKKRYHFNQEERFYCSVIMCAVQDNPKIAIDIFPRIKCIDNLEVYIETSIIRDHWMHLGKPTKKNQENLNSQREEYLKEVCGLLEIDFNVIKKREDYCSKSKFIQSPGNWKTSKGDDESIRNLRAIFNMRQDILIIENRNLHFIEAKLTGGNSKKQIENMLLLKSLHSKIERQWASIKEFRNIDNV